MAARLSLFVPRFVVLTVVALLATTTLTFAAENRTVASTTKATPVHVKAAPKVLVVPDVQNQVYVFAKGTLEEAGFAWKVVGSVAGYSANRVTVQSPAAGTRVIDTGAPTISLSLSLNPGYPQEGAPENLSPFRGTAVQYADAAANRVAVPKAKPKKRAAPKRKAPKKKHAPAPKPRGRVKAKPKVKPSPKPKAKGRRLPAFVLPGSRPEPQDELALPVRARLLATWLSSHRTPTDANVQHWLYQHAWVVAGARFGWWHGAEALETLIRVDQRVQTLWGIGAKSEGVARAALTEVRANSQR
jgi:PASTA domain